MEIDHQRKYWQEFARKSDVNVLSSDLHNSWNSTLNCYAEHSEISDGALDILKKNDAMGSVLDFGVGMGRNQSYLHSLFSSVAGFDTKEMVGRLKSKQECRNIYCDSDELLKHRFDVVYEVTVFHHMPPQEVLFYLQSLSYKTKYLFSLTRSYNDFMRDFQNKKGGVNMSDLVNSTKCYEKVWGEDFEINSVKMDEFHYKVLYKSLNC